MHSSGHDERRDVYSSMLSDAALICADDILDDELLDHYCAPLTVAETLLEVALVGPGPEAIGLLESLAARCQAANVAFMGTTVENSRDGARAEQSNVFELALATDVNDRFLTCALRRARTLATTLSATQAKLESGELSEYRVRLICDKLDGLDPEVAQQIEARVLASAGQVKVGTLQAKLRKQVLAAKGPEAVNEHLAGVANRRVTMDRDVGEPGLLGLHAYLPAETAVAVREALETKAGEFARADKAAAAQVRADGTEPVQRRTKDQRLADALAFFALGPDPDDPSHAARPQVRVQVTIGLTTLLHLREHPGDLAGYGPIPADIARVLAQGGDWQRFVHHPVTGYLIDVGPDVYRPPAALARFTQARDVTDRFPGSDRSARFADLDHERPPRLLRRARTRPAAPLLTPIRMTPNRTCHDHQEKATAGGGHGGHRGGHRSGDHDVGRRSDRHYQPGRYTGRRHVGAVPAGHHRAPVHGAHEGGAPPTRAAPRRPARDEPPSAGAHPGRRHQPGGPRHADPGL
jgi:hypothetical protein